MTFNQSNVKVIDFYNELKKNPNYLLADKIHLSNDGNNALKELLKNNIIVK